MISLAALKVIGRTVALASVVSATAATVCC
jgi:hypothetical protein